ncbi:NnrU family protein [Sphingomonas sp.]|uniref:NnrU family protein n=1 Tax=Sphingomonas sp. TaxID=28214 RepID=UPI00286DECD9|nr:NnrU family protein [Sphingomonas sp.]
MSPLGSLALACLAFVGSHFLLSHPLRAPLVARLGETKFQILYSLVALATFGVMIWVYGKAGGAAPLWSAGAPLWTVASLVMWFASILLVGSFVGNPALPGVRVPNTGPSGVLAITRHPMMWSFALWAIVHAMLIATPEALVLDAAILVLALGGSVGQDAKKRVLKGPCWHEWAAQTAFMPFGHGLASPGIVALVGGTAVFLLATWLHPMPVGVWHWLG